MKVLLGIGGTDDSLDALERTVERAVQANDELTVAILENPESPRDAHEVEEYALDVLLDAGLDADIRHVAGDPGSELVRIAEEDDFDQIALGGGERSPMGKIRLGHVAEFVLLNSRVSVTLVR
ncbi:universal stress protein [Halocalculus aciditolerans]|uniref:Universal stress protein UspA n=1 Tax=Halocalculus aciditolerans TaxID=1383812 RepID=A0A830FA79_9EURY|nr:universal stress protein [Halocalculus aciditolerans]GGL69634.1 universal stress protein UspA [Halocalculus aciditolerans]